MPRNYTISVDNITYTAAGTDTDLFSIDPAADKPTALKSIVIKPTSELAEAQEEWVRLKVIRGHTTVGSGGAAVTARPTDKGDSAYSGSVRGNDTTVASAGTGVDLWNDGFNVRVGYELFRAPEDWFWVAGADFLVVRLMSTVADDISIMATCDIVEIG